MAGLAPGPDRLDGGVGGGPDRDYRSRAVVDDVGGLAVRPDRHGGGVELPTLIALPGVLVAKRIGSPCLGRDCQRSGSSRSAAQPSVVRMAGAEGREQMLARGLFATVIGLLAVLVAIRIGVMASRQASRDGWFVIECLM
jgi:hypothetical protein